MATFGKQVCVIELKQFMKGSFEHICECCVFCHALANESNKSERENKYGKYVWNTENRGERNSIARENNKEVRFMVARLLDVRSDPGGAGSSPPVIFHCCRGSFSPPLREGQRL